MVSDFEVTVIISFALGSVAFPLFICWEKSHALHSDSSQMTNKHLMMIPNCSLQCAPTQKKMKTRQSRRNMTKQRRNDEDSSTRTQALTLSSLDDSEPAKQTVASPKTRRHRIKKGFLNDNTKHSKSVGRSTSTKPHDAPMQKRDIYFALDCEMVGVGPEGLDSALARVSIINWDNEIVLDTYVKVNETVTDYRTFVSGIRPEHIESDSAMSLAEVQQAATDTLRGKILVGHGLINDLKVIGIQHPWCDTRDTATYKPFMREVELETSKERKMLPRRLRDLTFEKLGKEIQVMGKAHSPVEDAIASMDLYKSVRGEWEQHMMKLVNSVKDQNTSVEIKPTSQRQVHPMQQRLPSPYPQHRQVAAIKMTMGNGYSPRHDPRLNAPLFPQGQMMMKQSLPLPNMQHYYTMNQQSQPPLTQQQQGCQMPQFLWKRPIYM